MPALNARSPGAGVPAGPSAASCRWTHGRLLMSATRAESRERARHVHGKFATSGQRERPRNPHASAVSVIAFTVLLSVVAHGLTANPLAHRYGPRLAITPGRPDDAGMPPLPARRLIRRASDQPCPASRPRRGVGLASSSSAAAAWLQTLHNRICRIRLYARRCRHDIMLAQRR